MKQILYKGHSEILNGLQLCPISINTSYANKWNVTMNDFVKIVKDGRILRDTLYRVGGMNKPKVGIDNYFMLLKYTEAFYPKSITDITRIKDNKYLQGNWCILDKFGNEKIVIDHSLSKFPSIIKNSCIYSIGNDYRNIETNEIYCSSYDMMESTDYLFLDNKYDSDEERCGIFKISKSDGRFEIIK